VDLSPHLHLMSIGLVHTCFSVFKMKPSLSDKSGRRWQTAKQQLRRDTSSDAAHSRLFDALLRLRGPAAPCWAVSLWGSHGNATHNGRRAGEGHTMVGVKFPGGLEAQVPGGDGSLVPNADSP
jgi:hypothetical protein